MGNPDRIPGVKLVTDYPQSLRAPEPQALTPEQDEILLEALRIYRAFGRYGEGRDAFQASVQEVIDIVST